MSEKWNEKVERDNVVRKWRKKVSEKGKGRENRVRMWNFKGEKVGGKKEREGNGK